MTIRSLVRVLAGFSCLATSAMAGAQSAPPVVGAAAKDFTLESVEGGRTRLSELTKEGPVVLVVLRGWPGYQCPICSVQVGSLVGRAKDFEARSARVVLVYPGPKERLGERAREFVADKSLPAGWRVLLDPDFSFTKTYGLRWGAPKETAYPSTFVIGRDGKVLFAKVSKTHGDRAKPDDVLASIPASPKRS